MKRSEFNLLVENWRKFLKEGVIQEVDPDGGVDDQIDDDTTIDSENPINQDSKSGVEDILSLGTAVTVVDLKGVSFEVNGEQEEYNENPATRRNLSNSWGMQVDPEEKLAADGIIVGYDSATKTYSVGPEDVSPDWPVLTNCVFGKNIIPEMSDEDYENLQKDYIEKYKGSEGRRQDDADQEAQQRALDNQNAQMSSSSVWKWAQERAQGMKF